MRTTIKVTDLDIAQWEYVLTRLERAYRFAPGTPRVCVEFELNGDIAPTHVEMPVREFMLFLEELSVQQRHGLPNFPDDAQEGHDHDRPIRLSPSTWPGCPPVRTYADGCQGYGPYNEQGTQGEPTVEQGRRLPVLPTAEQVRNLTAKDAAALARQMNEGQ